MLLAYTLPAPRHNTIMAWRVLAHSHTVPLCPSAARLELHCKYARMLLYTAAIGMQPYHLACNPTIWYRPIPTGIPRMCAPRPQPQSFPPVW
jgi:hypothetical protein